MLAPWLAAMTEPHDAYGEYSLRTLIPYFSAFAANSSARPMFSVVSPDGPTMSTATRPSAEAILPPPGSCVGRRVGVGVALGKGVGVGGGAGARVGNGSG